MPTPQQLRRALARADRGAALDLAEATVLLAATADDLDRLCAAAAGVRDAGLRAAGREGVVTYSPKVLSVPNWSDPTRMVVTMGETEASSSRRVPRLRQPRGQRHLVRDAGR